MSAVRREGIANDIRRGLAWSTVNNLVLRSGNLVLGIFLARLLVPEDFGVFAIALTVQSILLTFTDLGMSADLVRSENPARRAPTVATLSVISGVALALVMTMCAGPAADLMGAPDAGNVIAVLALTLVVSSAGVVPLAQLQRDFEQKKLFACAGLDFGVGTVVTITLVLVGMGPMALALGRVVAQIAATSLQFVLARLRPRFGFDGDVARSALAYGLPLAGANLLSWALLNIDNVAIARVAGTAALGLYVLAFNISSWPMNAIGQAIRAVSLAGFSRTSHKGDAGLVTALSLTWAAALPVGVLLAALAHPLVVVLYGTRWSASAAVLAALGIFGALRVAFDLLATYLMARGASRPVLYVQVLWFVALIPSVILATRSMGISGAAWAHLGVAAVVILPAYAFAVSRAGTPPRLLLGALWPPIAAAVPTWWVAHTAESQIHEPILALLVGGIAGSLTYGSLCYRWIRRLLPHTNRPTAKHPSQPLDQPQLGGVT